MFRPKSTTQLSCYKIPHIFFDVEVTSWKRQAITKEHRFNIFTLSLISFWFGHNQFTIRHVPFFSRIPKNEENGGGDGPQKFIRPRVKV